MARFPFGGDFSQTTPVAPSIVLCEDLAGDVWAGTADGLARVDRRSQRLIEYPIYVGGRRTGFSQVSALPADQEGFLWIGTMGSGLMKLNPERTRLTRYLNSAADPESLSGDQVVCR